MDRVVDTLQWVHGHVTVVIHKTTLSLLSSDTASMGPRSRDRGYLDKSLIAGAQMKMLQWVHGHVTVVIGYQVVESYVDLDASMGPRSRDRGYPQDSQRQ